METIIKELKEFIKAWIKEYEERKAKACKGPEEYFYAGCINGLGIIEYYIDHYIKTPEEKPSKENPD